MGQPRGDEGGGGVIPPVTTMLSIPTELLAKWTGGEWIVPPGATQPQAVSGVSNNSGSTPEGGLYVAIKGARLDGHSFVGDALSRGAAAALVSREWAAANAAECGAPLLAVDDTQAALSAAAAGWRRHVAPFIVGVTGSAGKTTVKEFTAAMLSGAAPTARTAGNFNNAVGLPLSLLAMDAGAKFGVFEIGTNHPGELAPLTGILAPDAAIVSSVGPVHIENYPSLDAIADEKATLPRGVPRGGFVVLEYGARYTERIASQCEARIVRVGLGVPDADFTAVEIDEEGGALRVVEKGAGDQTGHILRHGLPGRHQALNALMACAAARNAGATWEQIGDGLRNLSLPGMRWEKSELRGIRIVNDAYNANPLSMACALDTFAKEAAPRGRRWLALGDMLELGPVAEEAHRALGRKIAEGDWAGVVAVGPLSKWIADELCGGEKTARRFSGVVAAVPDAAAAGDFLRDHLRPGDALLLKASRGIALEKALARL